MLKKKNVEKKMLKVEKQLQQTTVIGLETAQELNENSEKNLKDLRQVVSFINMIYSSIDGERIRKEK